MKQDKNLKLISYRKYNNKNMLIVSLNTLHKHQDEMTHLKQTVRGKVLK